VLDAYNRRARLAPAALAAFPALVLLGSGLVSPKGLASITAIAGGAVGIFICALVRDLGRRLQPELWYSWGGPPTVRRLRWRDTEDATAIDRLHRRVQQVTGDELPSRAEEQADPAAADRRYDEAIAALRDLTRDRKDFQLVFEENANYGFRRNCLGLRPIALALAVAVLVLSGVLLVVGDEGSRDRFSAGAGVGAIAVLGWWRIVTPGWVRSSGEIYADRLLESVESLRRRDQSP